MDVKDYEELERFAAARDEDAFAALVDRHGPMVMGVCQRVLGCAHDAEDAFQATFLILARKARSLHANDNIGGWLHGVALRVALNAKRRAARHQKREREALAMQHQQDRTAAWEHLAPVLDEELAALPQAYRLPVLLCCVRQKTYAEAADELGVSQGTLRGRLNRGRDRLRQRLQRRGVILSVVALFGLIEEHALAHALPAGCVASTVKAATGVAAGLAGPALVASPSAVALMEETLTMMMWSRARAIAVAVLVGVVVVGSSLLAAHYAHDDTHAQVAAYGQTGPSPAADGPDGPSRPVIAQQQGKMLKVEEATQPELEALAKGNNAFAVALYQQLVNKSKGNVFISPFSIRTALAMTYAGARQDTATQMRQVLHFALKDERLHAAFKATQTLLDTGAGRGHTFKVANALWGQKDEPFLQPFLDCNQTFYDGGMNLVDFRAQPEPTRQTINRWVENKTEKKIKDLIPPGAITPMVRLVLTNAVYFFGFWECEFDKKRTKDAPFHLTDGGTVMVPTMRHATIRAFRYHMQADYQAIELPYKGGEISMIVLLPQTREGLPALEQALFKGSVLKDPNPTKTWPKQKVWVHLPRFRITWGTKDLGPTGLNTLPAMGMADAFDRAKADFSGINGEPPTSAKALFISNVFHKAFVDVNEEGTEAAAATAVVMSRGARPAPPPEFRADHPFLFVIRETRTGTILFMGRVMNPKAG